MEILRRFTGPAIAVLIGVYYLFSAFNLAAWEKAIESSSDLYDADRYDEALNQAQLAVRRSSTTFRLGMDKRQNSFNMLGLCYMALERYDEADGAFMSALNLSFMQSNLADFDMSNRGTVLNNLAQSNIEQERYFDAEACASAALKIFDRIGDTAKRPLALVSLAEAFNGMGEYAAAVTYAQEAATALERDRPDDLAWLAGVLEVLSGAYAGMEKYTEAEPPLLRAIELHDRQDNPYSMIEGLMNLSLVYRGQGRLDTAEATYHNALEVAQSRGNASSQSLVLEDFAQFMLDQERFDEAITLYERSLGIDETLYGEQSLPVKRQLNELALAYAGTGNYKQAERAYLRCLNLLIQSENASISDRHAVMENLMLVYERTGNEIGITLLQGQMQDLTREQAAADAANDAAATGTILATQETTL